MPDDSSYAPFVKALLGLKAYSTPDPRDTIFPSTSAGQGAEDSLLHGFTPGDVIGGFNGHRGDVSLPQQGARDPRLGPPTDPLHQLLEQLKAALPNTKVVEGKE